MNLEKILKFANLPNLTLQETKKDEVYTFTEVNNTEAIFSFLASLLALNGQLASGRKR